MPSCKAMWLVSHGAPLLPPAKKPGRNVARFSFFWGGGASTFLFSRVREPHYVCLDTTHDHRGVRISVTLTDHPLMGCDRPCRFSQHVVGGRIPTGRV